MIFNKSATVRDGLKQVGNSMLVVCQAQVTQLVSDSAQHQQSNQASRIS
ncbi:hypothetical protein PQR66_38915 [Paraburkholderia agricolaris]|uniref:Methyl-accepting chemotaxis protein n=1 Tax=Paraburkholderia agricolaris TaxID=2152888 RepID=A0ABW9A0N9_9BURK